VNEPASHGFVKFRVKPKPNLAPGTYITNNAHIIFDFNSPIYTNLVANRVVVSTGIKEITERNPSFIMMPNPADERTTIELESDAAYNTTLTIYDVVGARVITDQFFINAGYNSLELDTGSLKAGIYLVQLNYGNRTESRTLSIY
jgi:hypothetical protein